MAGRLFEVNGTRQVVSTGILALSDSDRPDRVVRTVGIPRGAILLYE